MCIILLLIIRNLFIAVYSISASQRNVCKKICSKLQISILNIQKIFVYMTYNLAYENMTNIHCKMILLNKLSVMSKIMQKCICDYCLYNIK